LSLSSPAPGRPFSGAVRRLSFALALCILAGVAVAGLALPGVGLLGAVAKNSADSFNDLSTQLVIPPLPTSSKIVDAKGNTIATLHGTEDRTPVKLSDVPVFMQQALIDIEDSRFYTHHGVDFKGLLRAAAKNQASGDVQEGGSTLTQQYVKNVLLESAATDAERKAANERTLGRKLREARYALALERRLSKKQILEDYLNIAYFGDGAYGIQAAAQHFFSVDAKDLNPVQAALLAGLVRNPSAYDPFTHPKAAIDRRDTVLDRMYQLGHVSKAQLKFAKSLPLLTKKNTTVNAADSCQVSGSPVFCRYVVNNLLADKKLGATRLDRERKVFSGGLVIHTTLDPLTQLSAQYAVNAVIPQGNRVAAATDVLQPGTGNVLAMAVNREYAPATGNPDYVHSELPYPTQNNANGFQAGSTFKLFTLAAALQQGLPVNTSFYSPLCVAVPGLANPPPVTGQANPCAVSQYTPNGVGYQNAEGDKPGIFSMVDGTWDSVNTYFVQLEAKVGVLKVRDMARLLGVTSNQMNDSTSTFDGVTRDLGTLTLGAKNVSVMDMATAYATIAAHGKRCYPKSVTSITSAQGSVAFSGTEACKQVLDPQIADTITGILEGVITNGTGSNNGYIGRTAAGKTGTTDDHTNAWFVGFVPQMAAAVWVGDSRKPQYYPLKVSSTTPEGVPVPGWPSSQEVYGGDLPTKIWAKLMQSALTYSPVEPMPPAVANDHGISLNGNGPAPPPPPPAPTTTTPAPGKSKTPTPKKSPTKPKTATTPNTAKTP
jgi:membrane peptidoglycan carboxypeptidase